MNDLQKENGTSIIFITHDLGVINEMADDVAVMYCGQVVEKATAKTIFGGAKVSHPYTEGLMYSIPRIDNITHKLHAVCALILNVVDCKYSLNALVPGILAVKCCIEYRCKC